MEPYFIDGEHPDSISDTAHCEHRNTKPTGEDCSNGCCDWYRCEDCGKKFLVECPD